MADRNELSEKEQELYDAMKSGGSEGQAEVVSGAEEDQYEPQEQTEEQRARDEKGRFAKKEGDEPDDGKPVEEPSEEPEKQKPEPGYVPLKALDSERGRRKDAEAELQQLRSELEQLRQQFSQPQALQPQQAPEEPPDPVVDKAGYDAYWAKKFEEVQKPYKEIQERQQREQQYQQAVQQLHQYASSHEQAFREEHGDKDYDGALNFMRERTAKNLKLFGVPEHQMPQALAQEEMKLVAQAYQQGHSPAALLYNLAVNSGYQPASQKQNGAEEVERLGEAQRRTQSMGKASGSPRKEEYTIDDLANMSQSDIAKLTDKDPDLVRRLTGG